MIQPAAARVRKTSAFWCNLQIPFCELSCRRWKNNATNLGSKALFYTVIAFCHSHTSISFSSYTLPSLSFQSSHPYATSSSDMVSTTSMSVTPISLSLTLMPLTTTPAHDPSCICPLSLSTWRSHSTWVTKAELLPPDTSKSVFLLSVYPPKHFRAIFGFFFLFLKPPLKLETFKSISEMSFKFASLYLSY